LRKGNVVKTEDLIALRPATGISPMEIDAVVGKTLVQDLKAGSTLEWNQLA
jgi:sialic acid synthase SpsE